MSHGDSGSPLVYLEKDGKYTQVGIVSFGSGDGCQVGTCDTKNGAQKHSLIFLNQSYELTTSSGEKVACNNFMI